jgi:hypothetical protein
MRTNRGALALLGGTAACLGAVAYAAAPPEPLPPAPTAERGAATGSLPRPTIERHPNKLAVSTSARFVFSARAGARRFQCRLDDRAWSACRTPVAFTKLTPGSHSFSVRALGRSGRHGGTARYRWRVVDAKNFAIAPRLSGLSALYPGAAPQALPVTITNPNPVRIFITSLRATATGDPPGCSSAENLLLTESSASSAAPLRVPAGGTVSLPAPGTTAPTIQLRDLPVNQDACQNTRFQLAFSGRARG